MTITADRLALLSLLGTPTGDDGAKLLTPAEVAAIFRVDPKTVTRWASKDQIPSVRTPGGHRRFYETDVRAFLDRSR